MFREQKMKHLLTKRAATFPDLFYRHSGQKAVQQAKSPLEQGHCEAQLLSSVCIGLLPTALRASCKQLPHILIL